MDDQCCANGDCNLCRTPGTGVFANTSNTSAWHGLPGLHQQARFFPRSSCLAAIASFRFRLANSTYNLKACLASCITVPLALFVPILNGFPHLVARSTFTVFGGMRQPLTRLS